MSASVEQVCVNNDANKMSQMVFPGFRVFNKKCHQARGHGELCSEDISCMFSDRSLVCHKAEDGVRSCECKEDTRWDEATCVPSPGSNKRPAQVSSGASEAVTDTEEEARDRDRGAEIGLIVNKVFSAVGFLVFVILIVGVFIIVQNYKYGVYFPRDLMFNCHWCFRSLEEEEDRGQPYRTSMQTFSNSGYEDEGLYER